jgi:hypothetical protein
VIWGVGIASIDPIRAVGSIRAVGGALRTLFDGMVAVVIVVFVVVYQMRCFSRKFGANL